MLNVLVIIKWLKIGVIKP